MPCRSVAMDNNGRNKLSFSCCLNPEAAILDDLATDSKRAPCVQDLEN